MTIRVSFDEITMTTEAQAHPKDESKKPEPKDNIVVTHHSATINGKSVGYTVTCGTLVLKEESEKDGAFDGDKPRATIFFTAYTRVDIDDDARAKRPITFSFNGGPGSSSVWLHLGVLGPKRVAMGDAGALTPPPYGFVTNEHSLLDVSDLVFIDPVGTGFSRAVEGEKTKPYLNLKKDIESVGDFIRLYCTRYQRWLSPKYLIGESYGTTRAAGLSGYLQERHGLYLNGLMLVSSVLDWNTIEAAPVNDLPYMLFLPTMTATAWYHKKLAPELQGNLRATLDEAEVFALGDYAAALMRGSALTAEDRARIVTQVARLTGLSEDFIDRSNLRVNEFRFFKELLRDQRKTVGRLDSRFLGAERDHAAESIEFDPSYSAIAGPYTAALNDYLRRDLKFESDLPYEILSGKVNQQWTFDHDNRTVSVSDTLRSAIANNPHLRVFVANGYYDLATPYFATEYTFNHLALPDDLRKNISMAYYEAGHMMYVHLPSLAQLKRDLAKFVAV
jgi:carboxypeptidase C (cathepsin A)